MKNIEDMRIWIEAIINSSDDAIISKDLNNIIVSWNKGAEALYGYKEEEVIGKPIAIIIPDDKKTDIQMTADLIETKTYIHHLETVRIAKDGRRIDVSVSVSPITNSQGVLIGSSAIARDITERKRTEESIRRSEERYRKIVELSPDAILIYQDNKIVFINQAGLKLFIASDQNDLIGKSIWTLFTPERHGIVRAHNQTMMVTSQPVPKTEHTVIRLDGKVIDVEVSACPITYEDKTAIYIIMRDITERKKTRLFLNLQYKTAENFDQLINLTDGITNVLKIVCTNLKFDAGRVWLLDTNENCLYCLTIWASDERSDRLFDKTKSQVTLQIDDCLPAIVWSTGEPFWLDTSLPANSRMAENYDFQLGIGIPIINAQEFIGVLELMHSNTFAMDNSLIEALTGVANQMSAYIKHKTAETDMLYLSKHDAATGLANRLFFEESLTFELYRARSKNKRLAVLLLDIDKFSVLNETLGHGSGDQVLVQISELLLNQVAYADNVARFAGDQFSIIFDEFQRNQDITDFITQVNTAVAESIMLEDQKINLKFNVGISIFPEDGDTVLSLMKNASIALNKAKQAGHGSVQFCTSDMSSRAKNRVNIEHDLVEALDKEELVLYYQPVVDTQNMTVAGFEALLRWNKNGSLIPPYDFVSILEDTRLIIPVGEWILNTACLQCKAWQQELQIPLFVSVNISPVQFRDPDIFETIENIINTTNIDPACLKVEITEGAIMSDVQRSIKILNKIKQIGAKIAIDDFGTGYSSLNYLRQLPIDYLKIDRSFVINMVTNPNDAAIVRAIIVLAENLGYKVIAEGIETEEQLKFINKLGCNEIQGYYFGRPMPVAEATQFLQQNKKIL